MAEAKRWIAETLFDDLGVRMSYRVDKVLYETQTGHQHLVLFEHPFFGKMLMLDGATQITTRDEFIYQEMMAHVPLFAHGARARRADRRRRRLRASPSEVLKHKTVRAPHPGGDRSGGGRIRQQSIFRNSPSRCSPTGVLKA